MTDSEKLAKIISDLSSELRSRVERLENRVDALELAMSGKSEEFKKLMESRKSGVKGEEVGLTILTRQYKKETGKNAVWGGELTKGFKKWLKDQKESVTQVEGVDFEGRIKDIFSKSSSSKKEE